MSKFLPPWTELLTAYAQGYFPMPNFKTGEIEWFRPNPRAILPLNQFHCSHSLRKVLRKKLFTITFNKTFLQIISACGQRDETWINPEFQRAYTELHHLGYAHSVEVWEDCELIGGLYGVSLGGAFFAESMFSKKPNASKIALFELVKHLNHSGFLLLEIQFLTPHLQSLGATEITDEAYIQLLEKALKIPTTF